MSCYEWSHGKIILPSAEFAPFRKAMQDAMFAKWKRAFDDSQAFWKSLTPRQKSNFDDFRKALNDRRFDLDTMWLIDPTHRRLDKPRRVLHSDVEWPTNRTTDFHESDLSLNFNRKERSVTFEVMENNHAREHADNTALARAFYSQIAKVKWTAGTGGVILGNDEYNRDAGYEDVGGGGSYVVAAYGYVGVRESPQHVAEFLNGKGQRVHVEVEYKQRTGRVVGKVVAGPARSSARRTVW